MIRSFVEQILAFMIETDKYSLEREREGVHSNKRVAYNIICGSGGLHDAEKLLLSIIINNIILMFYPLSTTFHKTF